MAMRSRLCAALLLAACATRQPASPTTNAPATATSAAVPVAAVPVAAAKVTPGAAAIAAAKTVDVDTPATDSDGNTLIVPAGWRVGQAATVTVLVTPEGDSRVALIDVAAPSREAARDAAWQLYSDQPQRPLLDALDRVDRYGWTRWTTFHYRISPDEKRTISLSTRFAAGRWCVVITDAADATLEKRGGQFSLLSRIAAKGYTPESFRGRKAAKLDAGKLEQLRRFVADAMAATHTPGVSYGVIQDGKVLWTGGLGVRALGDPTPVDAKTLYLIASNTKTLTTLMLAKLVDQHKLAWDAPVTSILPSFRLGSPEVTRQVLVKHLICACTGLPRQDYEWVFEWQNGTADTTMATLATMTPTSKFGELFQYSNIMAAAGGYVGGHAAYPRLELGAAYDRALQTLVLAPLGMTATTFDFARMLRSNHAMPHRDDVDGNTVLGDISLDRAMYPLRPAGAAWSNVDDLLKYVALELAEGKLPSGQRYISKDALFARRTPNVPIGKDEAYGMGLGISTRYDVTVYDHGGDLPGFHSNMMWIPDANVGAVVLTNSDGGMLIREELQRKLLELLYDGEPHADNNVAQQAKIEAAETTARRQTLTIPADPIASAQLAPRYHHAALGDLRVTHTDGRVFFDFGEFSSEAATRTNPDGTVSFILVWPALDFDFVAKLVDGKPALVTRDRQHEYAFIAQ